MEGMKLHLELEHDPGKMCYLHPNKAGTIPDILGMLALPLGTAVRRRRGARRADSHGSTGAVPGAAPFCWP